MSDSTRRSAPEKILFVTGRLAESMMRRTAESLSRSLDCIAEIQVMPITVAALMTPRWIAKHIRIADDINRVILPGHCGGDLTPLHQMTAADIELGPQDLRFLPEYLGSSPQNVKLVDYRIQIVAEINHAPRRTWEQIRTIAQYYRHAGADVIDIGCGVEGTWEGLEDCILGLRELGLRVSVDSLNPSEINAAVAADAEMVLSVHHANLQPLLDSWPGSSAEVVVIPDEPTEWQTAENTFEQLDRHRIPFRFDPILEPIGFGFAASLQRYMLARQRWPDLPLLMGIGNLTEMSEVDSAGINLLLLAVCEELGIDRVLTTEVINWARSSVRECEIARRVVHESIEHAIPPKHLLSDLVCLRDPRIADLGAAAISDLAKQIRDFNFRIFADSGQLHLLGGGLHIRGSDPFAVFDELCQKSAKPLTASHAFYLGHELQKAATALQLSKQYTQDQALTWGHLTVAEPVRHRITSRRKPTD